MPRFEKSPDDPVILAATRSPIGKLRGALAAVRPDDLLALAFTEAVRRAGVDAGEIDEAFAGCANQAGEDNRNVARMAVLLAGVPQHVPAVTVNRLCASGLEAVVQAARAVKTGDARLCLAGGVESMSRAPWATAKPDVAFPSGPPAVFDTALGWRFPNPALAALFPLEQMGETAENVVAKYGVSRADQDAFALRSHQRAVAAQESGAYAAELFAVEIAQKKGPALRVERDEQPRADSTLAALAKLKPAFKEGGSVTAGNASSLNDGSAAVVVASRAYAQAQGLKVVASIRGVGSAGVDPRVMGIGPVPATKKALQRAGLSIDDLDAVELNEAFAAQALAVQRELGIKDDVLNLHGGAIALGHPLGASGARLIATLLGVLAKKGGALGLATLCVGVGQGLSVVVEREA